MLSHQTKVLIFDVGGTVFDWSAPIIAGVASAASGRLSATELEALSHDCRGRFLELNGAVIRGERAWMGADDSFAEALQASLVAFGIGLDTDSRAALRQSWQRMPAWPDAAAVIRALRVRFVVAPLTVLSLPMVVGSSRASGIDWDCILSCDLLGVYKPDPRSFDRACELLSCAPKEVMMVASHPSDLRGAAAAGWRTAYVRARLFDPGDDYADRGFAREFDLVVESFEGLGKGLLG